MPAATYAVLDGSSRRKLKKKKKTGPEELISKEQYLLNFSSKPGTSRKPSGYLWLFVAETWTQRGGKSA